MPGMMDTILNLGLNDKTAAAMEKDFGERFAMVFISYHSISLSFSLTPYLSP
jgi:phosphoenolpyruvate synthase/pyruvate phosphate dikinase